MSNRLTFEILTQGKRQNTCNDSKQNFMEIDQELTEKSAKKTQRWWEDSLLLTPCP